MSNTEVLRKIDAVEASFAAVSPLALSNEELIAEADPLARRIAHSDLPLRDAVLVQELAARLEGKS